MPRCLRSDRCGGLQLRVEHTRTVWCVDHKAGWFATVDDLARRRRDAAGMELNSIIEGKHTAWTIVT